MNILIIEDEIELGESIKSYLKSDNLICDLALDTFVAKEMQEKTNYDCIILDVMLPQQSGIAYLTELSKANTNSKIIIISAKNSTTDQIHALNLGAIAYLVKPFHLATLNALVQNLKSENSNFKLHNYEINLKLKVALIDNKEIELNKSEIDVLNFLNLNKNKVVSKNAIAELVNQNSAIYFDNFESIDFIIDNLIKKLPDLAQYLQRIHHIAYKLT